MTRSPHSSLCDFLPAQHCASRSVSQAVRLARFNSQFRGSPLAGGSRRMIRAVARSLQSSGSANNAQVNQNCRPVTHLRRLLASVTASVGINNG